jgi:uncharacterized protein YicC (UPF0701 family)
MKKTRNSGCETENRTGDRRTYVMPEGERVPHPKCLDIATLESEVRSNKSEREKEFANFKEYVKDKFHEVNQLRQDVISDRGLFFTKTSHEYFVQTTEKDIKETKKTVERNSERLTNLENLGATKIDLDEKIKNLKEFHEQDIKLLTKDNESFKRLVWIGVGIAIAVQFLFHYFPLQGGVK